ncbi:phospholipase D-like domain-containing protein [Nocardioides sp. cx-169]|uniref:phospholipase D-like domain-containing protein n=1 Tax=Nocardioides sp. cx-169 TaxID=2899080 RepID=UPI001E29CB8E|nr:phospholipase D-like domain-containing protein [Nocardioides sp. cx-169]MCD4534162.1 phospholipase D-like domain-containing protein [Nocardioides sp. cx-169]
MTARHVARLGSGLALALALTTLGALPSATATSSTSAQVSRVQSDVTLSGAAEGKNAGQKNAGQRNAGQKNKGKKRARWTPRSGVLFNSPLGSAKTRYRLLDHITTAIQRAHKGSTVDVMSWNIMSRSGVNALINAQRRGVIVRVLMDQSNVSAEVPNPGFLRLQRALVKGNANRPKGKKSYAKTCRGSCRGKGGQAHSKFYLFSKTGTARHVTIQGSANLTAAAASNQWNDVYTFVNHRKVWNFGRTVFQQMWQDQPRRQTFVQSSGRNYKFYFSPLGGANYKGDPYQSILNQVKCTGARNAGTRTGRTIVRVAPDVIRNDRGMRAAVQFKRMHKQGCDIKIGYTVMGQAIHRYLRSHNVPIRHLVQDFNGDGEFDNYFHLKSISINGRIGKNRTAHVVINGSSNISGMATISDENITIMRNRGLTLRYQDHINYWYENFPRSVPLRASYRGKAIDPYANVDMD